MLKQKCFASFTHCSRRKMVRLELMVLLILIFTCRIMCGEPLSVKFSDFSEEIKKNVTKVNETETLESIENEINQCQLNLMPQQKKILFKLSRLRKKEANFDFFKWPKNYDGFVVVPYWMSRGSFTTSQLSLIRSAMDAIERETCIRFRLRSSEFDFVNIYSGKFCKSNLGKTGGAQDMTLNTFKCFRKGHIIHELLHALGFIHMHNRPDRDSFIKIIRSNVDSRFIKEFDRVNPGIFNYYGTPYDYSSIMHYGSKSASKNGGRTIITKDKRFLDTIGQRIALSEGDIMRINIKYNCQPYTRGFNEIPDFKHEFTKSFMSQQHFDIAGDGRMS